MIIERMSFDIKLLEGGGIDKRNRIYREHYII